MKQQLKVMANTVWEIPEVKRLFDPGLGSKHLEAYRFIATDETIIAKMLYCEHQKEWAEFIVRACNCHDELVTALTTMDRAFDQCGPWNDPYIKNAREVLHAALSKATGVTIIWNAEAKQEGEA